jgi:hypothetical protein
MVVPAALAELFAPLLEFHRKAPGKSLDDVRLHWDVRMVRGESEFFARSSGVADLPGLLGEKMKANSPAVIQQEVLDKIATPLMAACQKEGEFQNRDRLLLLANNDASSHPPDAASDGDRMAELVSKAAAVLGQEGDEDDEDDEPEMKEAKV